MLGKPQIKDAKIISCLQNEYGVMAAQVTFLPLGADINTAVYRAIAQNDVSYFVELRKDNFDPTSFLHNGTIEIAYTTDRKDFK